MNWIDRTANARLHRREPCRSAVEKGPGIVAGSVIIGTALWRVNSVATLLDRYQRAQDWPHAIPQAAIRVDPDTRTHRNLVK
jgi:hypothetical protein